VYCKLLEPCCFFSLSCSLYVPCLTSECLISSQLCSNIPTTHQNPHSKTS
jgi:hypothetical protein